MSKVYCGKCKHYMCTSGEWGGDYCGKKIGEEDTPHSRVDVLIGKYEIHNAGNDCEYFVPTIWLRILNRIRLF